MRFRVLGGSARCDAPWRGTLALVADGAAEVTPWLLLNLSGPVASRLVDDPLLAGLVAEPGAGAQPVLLTDARLDQVAGLISLRDGAAIDLYATPSVFEDLTSTLPVLPELQRHCEVHWHIVPVAGDRRVAPFQVRQHRTLEFIAFDAGPAPQDCVGDPLAEPLPGHCIALGVRDRASGRRALFARGPGAMALPVPVALDGLDCLLFDPAADDDDAGTPAWVDWLAALPVPRKVLLGRRPAVAGALAELGIEAGGDGLEIVV